jgi:hypothetical protein
MRDIHNTQLNTTLSTVKVVRCQGFIKAVLSVGDPPKTRSQGNEQTTHN